MRQRPDGRWEARITQGYDSGTGKQVRKSLYGSTQAEVLKKMREMQTAIDTGSYIEPQKMRVSSWLDIWYKEYTSSNRSNTRYGYNVNIESHIKPAIGNIPLQKLQKHDIMTFANMLLNEKGLSPKTIKNIHGTLHVALEQAVENGIIHSNPASLGKKSKLPKVERKEMNYLDDKQLPIFLKEIQGKVYEDLYYVDVFTGMRKGEITGLTWDDVDFENGTISVYKQLIFDKFNSTYSFQPLKTDKPRKITPAPIVIQRLKEVEIKQKENKIALGSAWKNDMNLVFTQADGSHLTFTTVNKTLKRRTENIAGTGKIRFHDLRHTFVANARQSGMDWKDISEMLGHATVAFTMDVYGHLSETMTRHSADLMEQYIDSLTKNKKA